MAISYTITITGARVGTEADLVDVVKELEVTVVGKDGAAQFALPTTVQLGAPDPDNFTNFADLTEVQLIDWAEAQPQLDPIKAHVAYVVAKEVEKLALTQKPLPWQPVPVTPAEPLAQ